MTESNLPALQADLARLSAEAQEWLDVEASDSKAVVHVGSGDPEAMRQQMVAVRREARERGKDLKARADGVREAIRVEVARQQALMEEEMRKALALIEPLKAQVKRMEEGIWTVNLYLGTSEEIVTLREGAPADKDEPIHLRTSVLAMDEEVALLDDAQGMDYRDVEVFDAWVSKPENLDQMLPERRGVVVFRPRAVDYHYDDDPLINDIANAPNRESYWLIRNGDRVYRMQTDFQVGSTLMPTSQEFTALFTTREWDHETHEYRQVEVRPGTREWEKAEKAQGAVQRHYMRVALILQGMLDRTEVFKPIDPINVMHQSAYDSGLVVVVNDTERAIGTGRQPYYDWIRERNAELRPGMRIIGTFRGEEWDETATTDYNYHRTGGNDRLSPARAERPSAKVLHTIEQRRRFQGQQGLVIRYNRGAIYDPNMKVYVEDDRPGQWYVRGGDRATKRRASAVILPSDITVIPFDLVTEAEMQEYLDARTERHAYRDSFPLLTAAIEAKRAEREAEAPFRDLLLRVLADDHDQQPEEVQPHLDALVHRFKVGNRWHRPLVGMTNEEEAKAIRLIRAEYKRIVNSGATEARDQSAVAALREHDPSVMFVGRLSSGKYVAFAPQPRQRDEVFCHQSLWVREHTTGKTARSIATREWVVPGVRGNKMTAVFTTDQWADWDILSSADDDLTDDEFTTTNAAFAARAAAGGHLLATLYDRERHLWRAWVDEGEAEREPLTDRQPRKARVSTVKIGWKRQGDRVILAGREGSSDEVEMSYAGNYIIDADRYKRADERDVYLPWMGKGKRRGTFDAGPNGAPRPGVLFLASEETVERFTRRVRAAQAAIDEHRSLARQINRSTEHLDRQQVEPIIEQMRVDFMAEWLDEELWEERRRDMTKNVKAPVRVHREWVHDRASKVEVVLWALLAAGHREGWERLTLADAYRLTDTEMPADHEPIAGLMLMSAEPVADEEDEG